MRVLIAYLSLAGLLVCCSAFSYSPAVALTGGRLLLKLRGGSSSSSSAPSIKELRYFDARGAAEVVRILLALTGTTYTDTRFEIKMVDGKFETPGFAKAKETGELKANMQRAPVMLFENGVMLGQSKAMERYIARHASMLGATPLEEALVDSITENVRDIKDRWGKIRAMGGMGPNAEKEAATKKWFEASGEYEQWLGKLEQSLPPAPHRSKGFAVGSSMTYADVVLWSFLKDTFDEKVQSSALEISSKFSELSAIVAQVEGNARLQQYLKDRPKTTF